jgi:hypothetical protein
MSSGAYRVHRIRCDISHLFRIFLAMDMRVAKTVVAITKGVDMETAQMGKKNKGSRILWKKQCLPVEMYKLSLFDCPFD